MKKIFSIFLSFIMLISIFVNSIYAEDSNSLIWSSLSQVMQGQSSESYPNKYTVETSENIIKITLIDDITADPYSEPLICNNTNIQVVLDLNGHVLNRNVVQNDGTIIKYDDQDNYINGYSIYVEDTNLKIIDSNPSTPHEGFIGSDYLWHLGSGAGESVTINGGIITGGSNNESAGGIQVEDGTLTIEGGNICGNSGDCEYANYISGGGLYIYNGTTTITNTNICYNTVNNRTSYQSNAIKKNRKYSNDGVINGAGIYQEYGSLTLINVSIHHNISRGNSTGFGGAVCFSEGILNVEGGNFSYNTAIDPDLENTFGFGGAFDLREVEITMSNCEVSNNLASGSAGLNLFDGNTTLTNVIIKDNTSKAVEDDFEECYGGGIYACGVPSLILNDVIITGNKSCWGGGIYLDWGYSNNTVLTMNGGEISNNSVIDPYSDNEYGYGGGIYSNESTVNLNDVKIINNKAESEGGGIMMYSEENPSITVGGSTVVSNNSCEENGGLEESNISFFDRDPYISISQTNPLTDDAEIGIAVNYDNLSDWNPEVNILPFFNGLNESNKDKFFLVNNGDPYNGVVFYIAGLEQGNNLEQTNKIIVDVTENGEVSVRKKYCVPGNTVNVEAVPSEGYQLKSLIYDDGKDNDITSTKSFVMPTHDVIIKALFEKIVAPTPSPKPSYKIPLTGIK